MRWRDAECSIGYMSARHEERRGRKGGEKCRSEGGGCNKLGSEHESEGVGVQGGRERGGR